MEILADSLMRKIKEPRTNQAIRDGQLLVLSTAIPEAGFNTGMAMSRNKYIYASSVATIVIKSDFNKGGTWAGAIEAIRHAWTAVFCWENKEYIGNIQIIKKGAIPLRNKFNNEISCPVKPIQLSLVEMY